MEVDALNLVVHEKFLIKSFVVILSASCIVALVFQRLRLALIPAFIFAGIIAGPSGLALVKSNGALHEIGHLAIVLLLFGVGMELHLSALKHDLRTLLGTSIFACGITFAAGVPAALLFDLEIEQALIIAMAFSLSSTALVLRMLADARDLGRGQGKLSLAVLVTQDLLVLLMLAAIPIIASWNSPELVAETGSGQIFGIPREIVTALGLVAIVLIGRTVLPPLLKESMRRRSPEVLMISGVAAALLAAYSTEKLGFSMEMGAFLIGFLLASSPFRHHLTGQIAPLRDLFMAVFFTTLGMELQLDAVMDNIFLILIATLALMLVKSICIALSAWIWGVGPRLAILVGLTLSQAGEFSLIILAKAADFSILSDDDVSILTGIVVVSLLVTPSLYVLANKLVGKLPTLPHFPLISKSSLSLACNLSSEGLVGHVIVAGYGPVGKKVVAELKSNAIPYVIIELNSTTVNKLQGEGETAIFGDVSSETVLRAANVEYAQTLVLTFPDPQQSLTASLVAHALNSRIQIIARAGSEAEVHLLKSNSIFHTISDEDVTGREMVGLVNTMVKGA